VNNSPMEIALEMVRLGFDPMGTLEDNMDGWTNAFADAIENLTGMEKRVFKAMQQLAKNRINERRWVDDKLRGMPIRTDCPREEDIT